LPPTTHWYPVQIFDGEGRKEIEQCEYIAVLAGYVVLIFLNLKDPPGAGDWKFSTFKKIGFWCFRNFNFKGYDPRVAIWLTLESGYNARVFNKYPIKYIAHEFLTSMSILIVLRSNFFKCP
jgi:hypothetical protein